MEMAENETDPEVKALLREFLEMLSKLDSDVIEDVKRRNPEMARTWRDIFEVDREIEDRTRTNLYTYVQDGAMALDYAARQANISTEEFQTEMQNHGYRVPQKELV